VGNDGEKRGKKRGENFGVAVFGDSREKGTAALTSSGNAARS
jgi:hypothetical protein